MNNKLFKLGSALIVMAVLNLSCASKEKLVTQNIEAMESAPNLGKQFLSEDQIDSQLVWKLNKMNGVGAGEIFDKTPTLKFDKIEKRIGGTTGCNNYNSAYTMVGESIFTLSKARTTRMMCPFKNDEAGFLKNLEEVNSAQIINNSLVLKKDGVTVLEFIK